MVHEGRLGGQFRGHEAREGGLSLDLNHISHFLTGKHGTAVSFKQVALQYHAVANL